MLAFAALLPLAACATPRPVFYAYPKLGITLVCADEDSIDRAARKGGEIKTDHGHDYPSFYDWRDKDGFLHVEHVRVPAFFDPNSRAIWMQWGDWCNTMSHELAHAEGLDPAYVEDNYPRKS